MKINLRKSSKKICLLLAICATALTFVPTTFAGKDGPEQLPPAKKNLSRDYFTTEEDKRLIQLVERHGAQNWSGIANFMPGRNARQCRERWKNYLDPEISNEPWTPEEDQILLDKCKEFGKKWSQIAKFFNKRTDINVKNRFHFLERQKKRAQNQFSDNINSLIVPVPSQPTALIQFSCVTNVSVNLISNKQPTNQIFIPQPMFFSATQNLNITTNYSINNSLIVNQGLDQPLTQFSLPSDPNFSFDFCDNLGLDEQW